MKHRFILEHDRRLPQNTKKCGKKASYRPEGEKMPQSEILASTVHAHARGSPHRKLVELDSVHKVRPATVRCFADWGRQRRRQCADTDTNNTEERITEQKSTAISRVCSRIYSVSKML